MNAAKPRASTESAAIYSTGARITVPVESFVCMHERARKNVKSDVLVMPVTDLESPIDAIIPYATACASNICSSPVESRLSALADGR
ncbi:hypothetical protein L2D14_03485 [Thalassospiraceae bacterium LMO-JJ14]|nr:hypothetical protein L2D14_03485 [Thalassospiraceae bacterium LMO-JJ14]